MPSSLNRAVFLLVTLCLPLNASAHPGHADGGDEQPAQALAPATEPLTDRTHATTGTGELTFIHRADLSALPPEIAAGIGRAHGGFAKTPDGVVYFGLEGVGLIRVSSDLTQKSIACAAPQLRDGGLHNTTYVDRAGGAVVLPDNGRGQIHSVDLASNQVRTLGRPGVNAYYKNAQNGYAPTDVDFDAEGRLFICDGYSAGKYVLCADQDHESYADNFFGGPVEGDSKTPGRFSTNHGITFDPVENAFWIADRERHWAQLIRPDGVFVRGVDTAGGMVCDIDLIDWQGGRLMIAGCLRGADNAPGVVHLLRDERIVSTLRPKVDLGLDLFEHIHNAMGVVVDGKLFILCYGWNPGCYAVLECVPDKA